MAQHNYVSFPGVIGTRGLAANTVTCKGWVCCRGTHAKAWKDRMCSPACDYDYSSCLGVDEQCKPAELMQQGEKVKIQTVAETKGFRSKQMPQGFGLKPMQQG